VLLTRSDYLLVTSVKSNLTKGCIADLSLLTVIECICWRVRWTDTFARGGRRKMHSALMLFVCLSARISQKPHVQISPNFMYMFSVSVARSSSYGNAVHYALPVLWMTSCFYIMEQMGQNQSQRICFAEIVKWRHGGEVCLLRLHLLSACVRHCYIVCSVVIAC